MKKLKDIKCLRETEFRIISQRQNLLNGEKFINTHRIYILILSSRFLRRNFIPFLIDVQAVIGKNPVIYYAIPARMFQGPSSKENAQARDSSLVKGLFIGNVFTGIIGFTFLV